MSSAATLPYSVNDTAVRTTLAEDITSTETSVDVSEVTNAPATPFYAEVFVNQSPYREDAKEIVEVTAISGTTLTVNRGQKGTTAQSFQSGDPVFMATLPADFVDDPGLALTEVTVNPNWIDDAFTSSGPSATGFTGAAQADDGRVIAAPSDNSNVGIFDPSNNSYTSGPTHGQGSSAYAGAVKADSGEIILIPFGAADVGIFDPSDDSYTAGDTHGQGSSAYYGGVKVDNGDIIFLPFSASTIGEYTPSIDTFSAGPTHGEGSYAFEGGARTANDRVIAAPYYSSNVGIYDPSNGSYTSGPTHGQGNAAYRDGALVSDGRIIFAPRDASNVGIFDPSNDSFSTGPTHGQGSDAFSGAEVIDRGEVVFGPHNGTNIGLFDPSDDTYSNGPSHGMVDGAVTFGVHISDDRVIYPPDAASTFSWFTPAYGVEDTVTADYSNERVFRVNRGNDGPIVVDVGNLLSGRGGVLYVSIENGGKRNLRFTVNGGSGTFKWADGITPSFGSSAGVHNLVVLKQTGPSEVTGYAPEV